MTVDTSWLMGRAIDFGVSLCLAYIALVAAGFRRKPDASRYWLVLAFAFGAAVGAACALAARSNERRKIVASLPYCRQGAVDVGSYQRVVEALCREWNQIDIAPLDWVGALNDGRLSPELFEQCQRAWRYPANGRTCAGWN